jgi:hypothetical protein
MSSLYRKAARYAVAGALGLSVVGACGFDNSLRMYLYTRFWQPFAKSGASFAKPVPARSDPYAGMRKVEGTTPLERLRAAYQSIAAQKFEEMALAGAVAEARSAAPSLSRRDREEVDLIDAKIDMRLGSPDSPERLHLAKQKLQAFLRSARDPRWRSEARGWLAHIHYLLDEQTAAGKIYLDELNRRDSNLSRETLLNSLRLTYGYDGHDALLANLEAYFDTPEHAAFAISMITNPRWDREGDSEWNSQNNQAPVVKVAAPPWERINMLLLKHSRLFATERGAALLTELGMRIALRAGEPETAIKIAAKTPDEASVRTQPDFLWMLGSANFLLQKFEAAEQPLLTLFESRKSDIRHRTAAAYALCGVYSKTGNVVEQIRMALWLRANAAGTAWDPPRVALDDMTIYWAMSGFDLGILLDVDAPDDALEAFVEKYPAAKQIRLVRYAIAVRSARAGKYSESAAIYDLIGARSRAIRMRQLAALKAEAERLGISPTEQLEAKYRVAEFLSDHSTGVYFNNTLWGGLQRYALNAETDSRLTRKERIRLIAAERQLKDQQEEYWRAYHLLREIMDESGSTSISRQAAQRALRCLRRINTERFGREEEIRKADIELTRQLQRGG